MRQQNFLVTHLTTEQLQPGLDEIRQSPKDAGEGKLIVRRPRVGEREILDEGQLDTAEGLVGDTWRFRPSSRMPDKKSPHPEMQINIMTARAIALIAQDQARWALAGDQLYIDLDLSLANLPAGTRIALGSAILEVTPQPHTGCGKFAARFGQDARDLTADRDFENQRLRGLYIRVVEAGEVGPGDRVQVLSRPTS